MTSTEEMADGVLGVASDWAEDNPSDASEFWERIRVKVIEKASADSILIFEVPHPLNQNQREIVRKQIAERLGGSDVKWMVLSDGITAKKLGKSDWYGERLDRIEQQLERIEAALETKAE